MLLAFGDYLTASLLGIWWPGNLLSPAGLGLPGSQGPSLPYLAPPYLGQRSCLTSICGTNRGDTEG